MKKVASKLMCFLCLTSCNLSTKVERAEQHFPIETAADGSEQLVCKLTGPEFRKRLEELRSVVFSNASFYTELEKGYVFQFEDSEDFAPKLIDYVLSERKCCPFFDFNLSLAAHEKGIGLRVTGPEGAKEMIELMIVK